MNFGLSVAEFLARYPASRQKLDLFKPKIHHAQLSDFILLPFLIKKG